MYSPAGTGDWAGAVQDHRVQTKTMAGASFLNAHPARAVKLISRLRQPGLEGL